MLQAVVAGKNLAILIVVLVFFVTLTLVPGIFEKAIDLVNLHLEVFFNATHKHAHLLCR